MSRMGLRLLRTCLLVLGIIIAVAIGARAITHRNINPKTVSVKGMASRDFTSDLAVWNCTFQQKAATPQEGFELVQAQRAQVIAFLKQNGIQEDEMTVEAVKFRENMVSNWNQAQQMYVTVSDGYIISQNIQISSTDIEKVDKAARKIGDLMSTGIMIEPYDPQYYYTKLADLKLEMLGEAAEDARNRAEQITKNSKSKLGSLKSSSMGVFQILGKNTADESYSWGGTFNTTSKEKTASITVTSVFLVK